MAASGERLSGTGSALGGVLDIRACYFGICVATLAQKNGLTFSIMIGEYQPQQVKGYLLSYYVNQEIV